jgi:hypothetical protein
MIVFKVRTRDHRDTTGKSNRYTFCVNTDDYAEAMEVMQNEFETNKTTDVQDVVFSSTPTDKLGNVEYCQIFS